MVTSTVRRKKKLYYDSKITDCQSNPKQLWNVIGQLTGRKQFDNIPADLSANDFNEYFSSIGSETVAHLSSAENTNASNNTLLWRGSNCISRFGFTDVSIESVSSRFRALGLSSKNDVLGFDCKLLSMCSDLIAPIITKFANASIHSKCFASYWKLSRVTPIYKGKGDANNNNKNKTLFIHRQIRCHGLPVYAVSVCNKVRLPGTGQSAHIIGGSRFTRPASNSRRTLLN